MKIFLSSCTWLVIIIVTFSSCQPEVLEDLPNNPVNDSTNIQDVIILDTTVPGPLDSALKFRISYDGSKRISQNKYSVYDPGTPGVLEVHTYSYKYTGTNPFPDYIIDDFSDLQDPSNDYTDTTWFTYANNRVSKDSLSDGSGYYIVTEFNPLSATRYKMRQRSPDISGTGEYIDTTYIEVNWQNGNLLTEIDSLWIGNPVPWDITRYTNLQYDTKPNPFKSLVVPYPTPLNRDLDAFGLGIFFPTTNNLVRAVEDGTLYQFNYEYGANGLPKYMRDDFGLKVFFKYTKL